MLFESCFSGWPMLMHIEWNDWTSCNIVIVNGNRGLRYLKKKEKKCINLLIIYFAHVYMSYITQINLLYKIVI